MRVRKSDVIAGLPAPLARKLVRYFHGWAYADVAAYALEVSEEEAEAVLERMAAEGYMKSTETDRGRLWDRTLQGGALAQASFRAPVKRVTAERSLIALLERLRAYNSDSTKILAVVRALVFGSYLDSEAQELGDLDVAIVFARRTHPDRYVDEAQAFARASGRRFGSYVDYLFWPETDMLRTLRGRSPIINITDEDVSRFTDTTEIVYRIEKDKWAIPLKPGDQIVWR